MEVRVTLKVGRWQLLGAATGVLIVLMYSAALQLHWRDRHLTLVGVDIDSTPQDRIAGYSFSSDPQGSIDPHGRPQLKSGPSQKEVEVILSKVEPEFQEQCRNILEGKPKSFSQIYQDWFLYHNLFSSVPHGEGFYVDIGANDAFAHSNTLFFDKCLGWQGLCWEPNKKRAPAFANRSCTLVPHCVHVKDNVDVGFVVGDSDQDAHVVRLGANSSETTVRCRQLDAVLREHGVSRIDFVSLDIEGAELHAVRCFPFDEWNVQAWVVETNKQDKFIDYVFLRAQYSKVAELLYRDHFFRHAGRMVDSVYVRNAQTMKYPSLDGFRTFKRWRREIDQDCSDEDRKWNNCDSTTGLPIFELREINGTSGEPEQWCQAQH